MILKKEQGVEIKDSKSYDVIFEIFVYESDFLNDSSTCSKCNERACDASATTDNPKIQNSN